MSVQKGGKNNFLNVKIFYFSNYFIIFTFLIFRLLDWYSTASALNVDGFYEMNPISSFVIQIFGVHGLLIISLITVFTLIILNFILYIKKDKQLLIVIFFGTILLTIISITAVLNNYRLLEWI